MTWPVKTAISPQRGMMLLVIKTLNQIIMVGHKPFKTVVEK